MKALTTIVMLAIVVGVSGQNLTPRRDLEGMFMVELNRARKDLGVKPVVEAEGYKDQVISVVNLMDSEWDYVSEISNYQYDMMFILLKDRGIYPSKGWDATLSMDFFYDQSVVYSEVKESLKHSYLLDPDIRTVSIYMAADEHGQIYMAAIGYL